MMTFSVALVEAGVTTNAVAAVALNQLGAARTFPDVVLASAV
jgi:hypothetical protein